MRFATQKINQSVEILRIRPTTGETSGKQELTVMYKNTKQAFSNRGIKRLFRTIFTAKKT